MKKPVSLFACFLIAVTLFHFRLQFSDLHSPRTLKVTTWDALGYYLYLPSIFIYNDVKEMKWFSAVDEKYQLSGGKVYQFNPDRNGNMVFKYLGGVAILEMPFFFTGHVIAQHSDYPADGFSAPYQYAISFGVLFYFILSLFILRWILLRFFSDHTVAATLILLVLATNAINYTAIEPAMSHGLIFPLYVLVILSTIKWHEHPRILWAVITGLTIGLATICRPTEAIMFLIPLLWNRHTKEAARDKWNLVKTHRTHILWAVVFGCIGILPQLIYWKYTTGSFVHNVASAWDFLTPHIRVLTGWNKGWFIYTPVTIFFIVGMFFIRKYPFRKAVIWFCLINMYIIISWRDWHYGGSYSTRALMQSYPVFALALAGFIERMRLSRWRYAFYLLGGYLIFVNFFQVYQYYSTVLHYYDMNRKYYARIYLDPSPSPLDVSLLDTREWVRNESRYSVSSVLETDSTIRLDIAPGSTMTLWEIKSLNRKLPCKVQVLKIETNLLIQKGLQGSYLYAELASSSRTKEKKFRLANPISPLGYLNPYAFYIYVPEDFTEFNLKLYLTTGTKLEGNCEKIKISSLVR